MTDLWDESAGEFQLTNEPVAEIDIGTPKPAADDAPDQLWDESADDLVVEIEQFQSDVATSRDPTTVGLSPEREARIDQISSSLGIPDKDYIRNNYDLNNTLFERKAARSEISDTPVTLGMYDDPATNGAAADDTQAMSYLERMFIAGPKAMDDKGTAQADFSRLGFQYMLSGTAPDEFLEEANKYRAEMSQKHDFGLNVITEIPSLIAEQVPIMGPILYESIDEALIGGIIGSQIPIVGTGVGFGAGFKFGMASNTAQFEAGASYADLVTTLDEDGEFIDPAAAAGASILVGIANGGIEMLAFGPLIRAMPGGDRLLSMFTREGAKQIVKDRTARAILTRIGKRITGAAVAEGATEGLQELVSDLGKHLTNVVTESDFDTPTLLETVGGMAESAIVGAQVGGGIGAIGSVVSGAVETKQARDIRIRQNTFEALAEQANNSKLRSRLPQRFKQFVDDVTSRNGTVDTVFMSSDEAVTFFQEMDEGLLKQHMPQTYESLQEAKLGGTDVSIPMGEFVTYVAPHENFQSIVQDIKFSPEEITARQSAEFQGREEDIKARQKELIDSGDLRPVFDDIAQKLIAQGQTKAAAYPQAALWQSTMESLSSQVNMNTEDFYKQFELNIQSELLKEEGGSIFEQEVEGTPAYEAALAKFGPEGMTTEARLARAKEMEFDADSPFFHTTRADINEFIPGGPESIDGQGAVFFTPDKQGAMAQHNVRAGDSGSNVVPVLLRRNNPLYYDSFNYQEVRERWAEQSEFPYIITEAEAQKLRDAGFGSVEIEGDNGLEEVAILDPANIRSVNAAFDPDFADSDNLLFQEETAYATAQTLVEAPQITLQDIVGKKVQFIMADLTAAGEVYRGLDGVEVDPIPLLGGPGFPLQEVYSDAGVAWVFRGPGKATRVLNNMNNKGADLVIVMAMDQNAHRSNSTVAKAMVDTFDVAQSQGRISAENMEVIAEEIRKVKAYPKLEQFPGFSDPKATHKWLDKLTFDERAAVAKVLESKRVQKIDGVPNLTRMLNDVREAGANGVSLGDSLMALELTGDRVQFREEGIPLHPDYEMGLKGKAAGKFVQPINWNILLEDKFNELGKPINAFNVDRIGPIVEITQEMADKAALIEGLQTPTSALASMAAALSGNWSDTQTAVNKGGVSPKQVEDAIKSSKSQATLTKYTAKEINAGAKDGSLVFHRLGQSDAYFGIAKGYDYKDVYGFEHPDLTDNETVMVGVVNNTQGASGLGPAQVLRAIELGVTSLDAFSVKTDKYPSGFLPEFYGTFGFEQIGEVAFDEKYYSANELADLKASWKSNGWKESSGYPSVAIMKWRGEESDRAEATVKFIGKDYTSSDWSNIDSKTEKSIEGAPEQATGSEASGAGNRAGDTGADRDGSDRFTSRLVTAISDLQSLSPEVASLYGVTNESVQKINERFGTKLYQSTPINKQSAQGYIQISELRDKFTITLTGRANMSTFLHESGHAFLEMMTVAANMDAATPQLKMDMAVVRDWLGMAPGEKYTTKHHEMWARGFEAYLMEGKAPSTELALAFERFKSWLVSVYKTIEAVLAIEGNQLNDDIRGVFDRLVAVDQGMANAAIAYPPMFKTAAEAGMSQIEFERYLKAHDDAMEEAKHLVEREAIMDARKIHRQEYKDRKAAITAEVTAQLEKDPAISVKQFLSLEDTTEYTNVPDYLHGHKMDTELTKQVLGVDILPAKLRPYVSKDTALSPDELAPLFGFEAGIDMLQGMEDAGTMKGEVSSQVSARMKEEFPDYHMDGRMEADIIEEVHSNKMGLHILAELKAIGRRVGNKVKTSQIALARLAAREKVRDIPLNRLKPNTYLIAEKKASKESSRATAKGDFEAASQFKLQQLLNFYMYKESIAAKDKAEKVRAKLDKREKQITKKNNVIGKAGDVYVNAINSILQGIEFRRVSNKALDQRSRLADYLAKMEADGDEVLIPDSYRDATALTNYREMTLNELEGVFDAVEQIASTARLKNQLVINKERRDLREFVDHVTRSMEDNAKKARSKPDFRENFADKAYTKWESAVAALTKVEFIAKWIDGKTAGLFHKVFFQPFVDAQNSKHDKLKALNEDIKKILRPAKNMNGSVKLFGETMTREQVYAVALNMGNDGNFNKLVKGYESKGWTKEGLVAEIQKVLTADDFQRIQEIWDVVNSLWPQMSDVYMRTHGVRPPKVEASALVLDDLGITLRGGYYPIVYDAKLKQKHKTKAGVEDLFENNLFKPNVSSGFMESRTEFYDPIKLSLSVLGSHLNEVVHFITHYEAVRNANKIITDDAFALAFKEHFGHAHYNGLRPWLKNIANDGRPTEQSPFSFMANHMRIGLSMTSMAFNMGTAIMQGFGMFTTIDEIGMKNTLHGMRVTLLGGPSAWKFAIDKSGELRHILKQADREIADTVDEMFRTSKFGRGWNSMKQFAFWHIAQAQRVVNIASWYGAYDQAIGDGLSDKDAANKADAVVRMTQSGAGLKDLAAVQRGGEGAKLFTAFYTYFSVLFNRERNAVRELRTGKAMQFAWSMMWLVMAPVYFEAMLRNKEPEDDESGATWFAKEAAAYSVTSIPVVGAAISAVVSPYPFRASPAAEGFSKAANTLLNLADKDFEDMTEYQTKSAIEAIGTLFHIPTKPITRFNTMMGEDDPEAIARAFLFGQRSE